jgi:hypothetical protein
VPRKIFVAGEILTAADVNSNLMDQAVMVFNDATARDTAIPSPIEGMVVYLKSPKSVQRYNGTAWVSGISGFTHSLTLISSNASYVPPGFASWSAALGSPIVKVTAIGGGGGGGASATNNGGTGTSTTFNAGGAGTVTAAGGIGGFHGGSNRDGAAGENGFASQNGGGGGLRPGNSQFGAHGEGGKVVVAYLNLGATASVNVTIGAGGAGGVLSGSSGGAGGNGLVIVEYVAA